MKRFLWCACVAVLLNACGGDGSDTASIIGQTVYNSIKNSLCGMARNREGEQDCRMNKGKEN